MFCDASAGAFVIWYAAGVRRAFSLLEMMAVIAVVGIAIAVGLASTSSVLENARRAEQAKAALAQIKKARADALASSNGAAFEAVVEPGGGVRLTTATVPRLPGTPQCDGWPARATSTATVVYDLIDMAFPRADNTLCFDASGFRLLAADGLTMAPTPLVIDLLPEGGGGAAESLTVQPSGAISASFDDGVQEGLAATVNIPPPPAVEDPSRNVVEPDVLVPELPVTEPPPPDPVTPDGDPDVEPLPAPEATPPPPPPPDCVNNADCPFGFICVIPPNTCEPVPPGCLSDQDCPDPEFGCNVATGECTQLCNQFLCPPGPCGGCRQLACCTVYGCMCA